MKQQKGHIMDVLFTLALFCVFAASALMVVVIGASVYQRTVDHMEENYNTRTSLSYLAEKVRQNDVAGGVSAGRVDGGDALVLTQKLDSGSYQTWIFVGNGQLREVMVKEGVEVKAKDGQPIMELSGLSVEMENGLLHIAATDTGGRASSVTLRPRCG